MNSKPTGDEGSGPGAVVTRLASAILEVASAVPGTTEPESASPAERARAIQAQAALKASLISGTLALPPGPLGIATIVPDLIAVWRIQAQMVADIAAAFGKSAELGREQMLYCLFRHAAAQVVRDLGARVGERLVFRRATIQALQGVARRVGIVVTERALAKTAARWIPILGSVGVAGYAYYDTVQVGATAIRLLEEVP